MKRFSTLIGLFAIALPLLGGCSTNLATGRSQLNLLSRSGEIAIGTDAAPALVEEYGGEVANERVSAYVEGIGRKMIAFTEGDAKTLPWEFFLLDSDVINAFALPGGKVFVSRGLAVKLSSEAELAGVIGHEIGHVTARHTNERISQGMLVQLGVLAAGVGAQQSDEDLVRIGVPLVVGAGGQGYMLKFGRSQELESDKLGLRYMAAAGYDPAALLDVMEVLKQTSSGNQPPEFLSTHPYAENRMKQIRELLRDNPIPGNPTLGRFERQYESQLLEPLRREATGSTG
jgi:predicted Zn-dependent protease